MQQQTQGSNIEWSDAHGTNPVARGSYENQLFDPSTETRNKMSSRRFFVACLLMSGTRVKMARWHCARPLGESSDTKRPLDFVNQHLVKNGS